MHGFDPEFVLDLINEHQTAHRDCLRPAFVSHPQLMAKRFAYPLLVGLVKIRHFRKATLLNTATPKRFLARRSSAGTGVGAAQTSVGMPSGGSGE